MSEKWKELKLSKKIIKKLKELKFDQPKPIQRRCIIPAVIEKKDILASAETGSGKTLAFGLPIIQVLYDENKKRMAKRCEKKKQKSKELIKQDKNKIEDNEEYIEYEHQNEITNEEIQRLDNKLGKMVNFNKIKIEDPDFALRALILEPTRELAIQVTQHLELIAKACNLKVIQIVGGLSKQKEHRQILELPDIIVATPGRYMDFVRDGIPFICDLSHLNFLVIDEADMMIRHGQFKDMNYIIDNIPEYKKNKKSKEICDYKIKEDDRKMQTFMFSATLFKDDDDDDSNVNEESNKEKLRNKIRFRKDLLKINLNKELKLTENVYEAYRFCEEHNLIGYLFYILKNYRGRKIVFVENIPAVKRITETLKLLKLKAMAFHSAKQQRQRLKMLDRFKENENAILVSTDVTSRGIDIKNIRCVIHYSIPSSADVYIHRCGRTARVDEDGIAISLLTPNNFLKFDKLLQEMNRKPPPEFPIDMAFIDEYCRIGSIARKIVSIEIEEARMKSQNKSIDDISSDIQDIHMNENHDAEVIDTDAFEIVERPLSSFTEITSLKYALEKALPNLLVIDEDDDLTTKNKEEEEEKLPEKMIVEIKKGREPAVLARRNRSKEVFQKRIREVSSLSKLDHNSKRRAKFIVITPDMLKKQKSEDAVEALKEN